jgi:hypothetical protein
MWKNILPHHQILYPWCDKIFLKYHVQVGRIFFKRFDHAPLLMLTCSCRIFVHIWVPFNCYWFFFCAHLGSLYVFLVFFGWLFNLSFVCIQVPVCVLIPPWCVPNFFLCTFSFLLYVSIPPWCVLDFFLCTFSFPLGVLGGPSI